MNWVVKMELQIVVRSVKVDYRGNFLVPNILVGPNRKGPSHLTSDRNFRNFSHHGKHPKHRLLVLVAEWFRALDLKSGGPWFKSSALLLSGFVLGSH